MRILRERAPRLLMAGASALVAEWLALVYDAGGGWRPRLLLPAAAIAAFYGVGHWIQQRAVSSLDEPVSVSIAPKRPRRPGAAAALAVRSTAAQRHHGVRR